MTHPMTTETTDTSTSLSPGALCSDIPQIPNSVSSHDACAGTASGEFCSVTCVPGYKAQDSLLLVCRNGRWHVRGECIEEGVNVTEMAATQILLHVNLDLEAADQSDGLQWAQQHLDPLYWAFAKTLNVHPAELRLQLFPSSGAPTVPTGPDLPDRRLAQLLAFDVRLTLLLEAMNVSHAVQTTQVLEGLPIEPGMSLFEQALKEELNATDDADGQLQRVSFGSLGNAEVLDRYFLPEALWRAGPWDSAACSCGDASDNAVETSEVTCSRGSWLLCSGPVESLAGPRPASERPCSQCPGQMMMASVWIPLAALGVGLGCCMILGFCVARRCLKFSSRMMPQQSFAGKQNLQEVGVEATYHVEPGIRPMKSRKSSGDEEAGFLRRMRTMKSTVTSKSAKTNHTEKSGPEMKAAKTKVVWDLDVGQLSTMLMEKTRSLRSLRDNGNARSSTSPSSRDGARMSSFDLDMDDMVSAHSMKSDRSGRSGRPASPSSPSSRARRQASGTSGTLLESPESPVARKDTEITVMQSSI
eukprot:s320_g33.t1